MNEINPALISEIRILLVSEESEFQVERAIIHEVIWPKLRKHFAEEFNIDFSILDVHETGKCSNLPIVEKSDFLLSEINKCQAISNGLSALFLIGDNYGKMQAPRSLTNQQFMDLLNFLKSKNDPSWIMLNTKYSKNPKFDEYLLDKNIADEENFSILNAIDLAISSGNYELTPSSGAQWCTSTLEKCLTIATSTMSSTQIIHRSISQYRQSKELQVQPKTVVNPKIKEKYENLIKFIKAKFVQENYIKYSVSNFTLSETGKDLDSNPDRLSEIFAVCNFNPNKVRLLTKDLRVNSSSDVYVQIFIENVFVLIRDKCTQLFMEKQFSQSLLNNEILAHKILKIKSSDVGLVAIADKSREREINICTNYLSLSDAKMPMLIHGQIGSGKSVLLSEIFENIEKSSNAILVIRKCGRTISSSSLQLLLASITQQIESSISKSYRPSQACEYASCVYEFFTGLNKSTENRPIIIFLDDVDKLFPSSHADMVKWLPHSLPKYVKLLLASSSDSFHQGFKKRYGESNIITIPMIDSREAIKLFRTSNEACTKRPIAENVLSKASYVLQENSSLLFFSLLNWSLDSFEDSDNIISDTKFVFKSYLKKLESSYYPLLFRHILSYLALSRFGLSLSELVDILSLDNRILESVNFDVLSRKYFKCPTFIVQELLNIIGNLLEYVQTNRRLVFRLRHQIYVTTIIEAYHLLGEDGKYFLENLCDYWTSEYENDKGKSLDNDNLPSKESFQTYLKRNIVPQPYYTINKSRKPSVNERKLTELPYLWVTFDKLNELYKMIIFNFEYLFATLHYFGLNQLISEIYFCRQIKEIKDNTEVELLLIQLRLLSSEVISDARLIAPELTGRLAHCVGTNPLISYLHQSIDTLAPKVNIIVSVIPSYPIIGTENILIEMDSSKNIILSALSTDNLFISTIHLQKPGSDLLITTWDARTATRTQIINLSNIPSSKFVLVFYIPQRNDLLMLQYENPKTKGFFTVNLDLAAIENSIKFPTKSSIMVQYISKSYLYLLVNGELQILSIQSLKKDQTLTKLPWPTILTSNDKYLIGQRLKPKKNISEEAINFNLKVLSGGSREMICQLILHEIASYILVNARNETLFVSTKSHGIIYKYEIGQIAKKNVKRLKFSCQLSLGDQSLNDDIKELLRKYSPNIRAYKLQLSVDEKYLLSDYSLSDSLRLVAVWNVANKVTILCYQVPYTCSASFSAEGQYFYSFGKNETLRVFNLLNGNLFNFNLDESPDTVYMLSPGSFFMAFPGAIKLMSLKTLIREKGNLEKNEEFHQERFQISLPNPKINEENLIIFSNSANSSKFIYFTLKTNSISTLDISHSNKSLTEFPTERILSPDAEKLLLVYGFQPAETVKQHKNGRDVNELMMKLDENGFLISNRSNYRKPQIPGENYFLGKDLDSNKSDRNCMDIYRQKIVKIINLNTFKTMFQVSLIGEEILAFTDTILLTFKPDYSNLSKSLDESFDIVNVYHINEGRYVSSLYLEHSVVDAILIPWDKEKLLVCCGNNGRLIKILGGEYFSTPLLTLDIQAMLKYFDEFARSSVVTKLLVFKEEANSILIQFCWLEPNSNIVKIEKESHYAKVDLHEKEIICQFSTLGKVVDVSHDGQMAVDSLLIVYDLSKGSVIRKLHNSIGWSGDISLCNFTSFFSHDSAYVVTLDPKKGVIWVIMNNDQRMDVGRALLTPTAINNNHPNKVFQMSLGLKGRLALVYNDQEFKLFFIKMAHDPEILATTYKSSVDRITKLLYTV